MLSMWPEVAALILTTEQHWHTYIHSWHILLHIHITLYGGLTKWCKNKKGVTILSLITVNQGPNSKSERRVSTNTQTCKIHMHIILSVWLSMSRQQLSFVIGMLTEHLGLYGHLHKSFKQKVSQRQWNCSTPAMWMWISDNVTGSHFWTKLQQLSHVPVDLFGRFATEIGPAGK